MIFVDVRYFRCRIKAKMNVRYFRCRIKAEMNVRYFRCRIKAKMNVRYFRCRIKAEMNVRYFRCRIKAKMNVRYFRQWLHRYKINTMDSFLEVVFPTFFFGGAFLGTGVCTILWDWFKMSPVGLLNVLLSKKIKENTYMCPSLFQSSLVFLFPWKRYISPPCGRMGRLVHARVSGFSINSKASLTSILLFLDLRIGRISAIAIPW